MNPRKGTAPSVGLLGLNACRRANGCFGRVLRHSEVGLSRSPFAAARDQMTPLGCVLNGVFWVLLPKHVIGYYAASNSPLDSSLWLQTRDLKRSRVQLPRRGATDHTPPVAAAARESNGNGR